MLAAIFFHTDNALPSYMCTRLCQTLAAIVFIIQTTLFLHTCAQCSLYLWANTNEAPCPTFSSVLHCATRVVGVGQQEGANIPALSRLIGCSFIQMPTDAFRWLLVQMENHWIACFYRDVLGICCHVKPT